MRRDMDLMRALLLGRDTSAWTKQQVFHHGILLSDAGWAKVASANYQGIERSAIMGLTPTGHDIADLMESDEAWAYAKSRIARVGGAAPFDVWRDRLERWQDKRLKETA